METKHEIRGANIRLLIPAKNEGKFRFKKRDTSLDFGRSFSTREEVFDDRVYLEWQIGYDVPVADVEKGKKSTELTSRSFIGSNGKRKYPYELSEVLLKSVQIGLLPREKMAELCDEVGRYEGFIDQKPITTESPLTVSLNGLTFRETATRLPTLYMTDTPDGTQIEVSIEKQQYATGVQPMVYFCIPFPAFQNAAELRGKPSVPGDELVYAVGRGNVTNLVLMMKVFAMVSERHHHDVKEILKLLMEMGGR